MVLVLLFFPSGMEHVGEVGDKIGDKSLHDVHV